MNGFCDIGVCNELSTYLNMGTNYDTLQDQESLCKLNRELHIMYNSVKFDTCGCYKQLEVVSRQLNHPNEQSA